MKECCKNCKHYKELQRWTYTETMNGQEVEHVTASGFACLGLVSEGTVVNMVGIDENTGMCEMFTPKEI